MKKVINIIIFSTAFLGLVVLGTWISSFYNSYEVVIEGRLEDCRKNEDNIKKQIISANYCLHDQDCKAIRIGCPWGDKSPCRYVIINKNHSVSLLQKEAIAFRGTCTNGEEEMQKKYSFCAEENNKKYDCPIVEEMTFRCVNKKCVEAE